MRPPGFHWLAGGDISVLVPDFFDELNLRGGYSTRASSGGGDLDFDLRGGKPPAEILDNRRLVCAAMGVELGRLVVAEQVHGAEAVAVSSAERGRGALSPCDVIAGVDALATDVKDLALAALGADCPIVLAADSGGRAVASLHCGWRGTAAGVVPAALAAMRRLGAQPQTVYAAIGPSIGPCCYEVGRDVRERFAGVPGVEGGGFAERGGRLFLDLPAAVRGQLLDCGVPAARIFTVPLCTSCEAERFFSYRREGDGAGRCAGVIAMCGPSE